MQREHLKVDDRSGEERGERGGEEMRSRLRIWKKGRLVTEKRSWFCREKEGKRWGDFSTGVRKVGYEEEETRGGGEAMGQERRK